MLVEDLNKQLLKCASEGDLKSLKKTLYEGANVHASKSDKRTALHRALSHGYLDIVKYLLEEHNADINAKDRYGETPFYIATKNYKRRKYTKEDFQYFLKNSADVYSEIEGRRSIPLHNVIENNDVELLGLLLKQKKPNLSEKVEVETFEKALQATDKRILESIFEAGFSINAKGIRGRTVLHYLARENNIEGIQYFLAKGANSMIRDDAHDTPVHLSIKKGSLEAVKLFIQNLKSKPKTKIDLEEFLKCALTDNKIEIAKYLIEEGALFEEEVEKHLHTAIEKDSCQMFTYLAEFLKKKSKEEFFLENYLHLATSNGSLDIVKYLLKHGVDVDLQDDRGDTASHVALRKKEFGIFKFLIQQRANPKLRNNNDITVQHILKGMFPKVDVRLLIEEIFSDFAINVTKEEGRTLLHDAAYKGDLETIKCLIALGAKADCKDKDGGLPLHAAAFGGHKKVIQYFVNSTEYQGGGIGIKLSRKGRQGQNMLHYAAYGGHTEILDYLIQRRDVNFHVNEKDDYGKTPLHCTIYNGSIDTFCYLLSQGANPEAIDNFGNTILHEAVWRNKYHLIHLIIENELIDIKAKNQSGNTALEMLYEREPKDKNEQKIIGDIIDYLKKFECIDVEANQSNESAYLPSPTTN